MKRKRKWIVGGMFLIFAAGVAGLLWKKPDWRLIFTGIEMEELNWQEEEVQEENYESLVEKSEESQGLLLVNTSYPIPENFSLNLEEYKNSGVFMQKEMVKSYEALAEAVKKECNEQLFIKSSYRNREEQEEEYAADPVVAAVPGTSEHETGLALDVYVAGYAGYGFLKSEAGQYVNTHCWEYGFIIRYPLGDEEETGIPYEPWHLRYVGTPHAEIMEKNDWTLEEYLDKLKLGKIYQVGENFVSRQKMGQLLIPAQAQEVKVSPDNCGNCVVWGKL